LRGEIAQLQIELARIEFESVLRKRLNQLARDCYQLLYTENAIDIATENRALAVNMESVAIAQLKVARATQADALKAQTIVDVLDDRLHALEQEREAVFARLNSSLVLRENRRVTMVKMELTPPQANLSELIAQALKMSQDVAASRKRLQLLEASTRLAETAFPLASSGASRIDLNGGAEAGPTRSGSTTFPEKVTAGHIAPGLGPTLAYLEELKLRQQELAEKTRSIEAEAEYRVRAASLRLKASENSFQVYDQLVVPKLRRVYSTTLEQYNTDRASFTEFANTGRDYLDAQLDRERALFERHLSLIDLQDSLGKTVLDILSAQMKD
jgi:outer membrane protein TolC